MFRIINERRSNNKRNFGLNVYTLLSHISNRHKEKCDLTIWYLAERWVQPINPLCIL